MQEAFMQKYAMQKSVMKKLAMPNDKLPAHDNTSGRTRKDRKEC